MKFKRIFIFIVVCLIVVSAYNYKKILKHFYPLSYYESIYKYSAMYKIDPFLVTSVIKTESNFNSKATSSKNARGLMQITDDTATWAANEMKLQGFKTDKLYDPSLNIKIGCWYLKHLLDEFDGNIDVAVAAYNGGIGNVKKWLQEEEHSKDGKNLNYIPFKETDMYLKRVKVNYYIYKWLYKK